jgi:hypothetical protein
MSQDARTVEQIELLVGFPTRSRGPGSALIPLFGFQNRAVTLLRAEVLPRREQLWYLRTVWIILQPAKHRSRYEKDIPGSGAFPCLNAVPQWRFVGQN